MDKKRKRNQKLLSTSTINGKWSQFSIMNGIMNDKKGHNIVNNSFAHKPDGLLVLLCVTEDL